MTQELVSFSSLFSLPIAHTDAGFFLMTTSGPQKEFLMKAKIKRARASLFFIEIEDKQFTTHKNSNFDVGEEVVAVVRPVFNEDNTQVKDWTVSGLEKLEE